MNKWRKALPSLVYLAVAALFFWQSFSIQQSTSGTFGAVTPQTVPLVIILCLAVCAVINLVHDLRAPGDAAPYIVVPGRFLLTAATFLVGALIVKHVGFILTGGLFLSALFLIMDERPMNKKRVLLTVLAGFAVSAACCYGFRYGLNVRLPLYPNF